jgi:hypothetical protein
MVTFFLLSLGSWLLLKAEKRIRAGAFLTGQKQRLDFPSFAGKMMREDREHDVERYPIQER